MSGIQGFGPDSGQKPKVIAIIYLGDPWTFTEDSDQGLVNAVNAINASK